MLPPVAPPVGVPYPTVAPPAPPVSVVPSPDAGETCVSPRLVVVTVVAASPRPAGYPAPPPPLPPIPYPV